jgi:hypothetical protein
MELDRVFSLVQGSVCLFGGLSCNFCFLWFKVRFAYSEDFLVIAGRILPPTINAVSLVFFYLFQGVFSVARKLTTDVYKCLKSEALNT